MRPLLLVFVFLVGCEGGAIVGGDPTPGPEPTPEPTPDPPTDCEGDETRPGDVDAAGALCEATCLRIEGDLHVSSGTPDLSCLLEVGGDLLIDGYEGERLALPLLEAVGGSLRIDRNRVATVEVPVRLASVGDDLRIDETNGRVEGRFDALRTVGGALVFNVLGGTARFPILGSAGAVEIVGSEITAVDFPALRATTELEIAWAEGVTSLGDIGALEEIDLLWIEALDRMESLGGLRAPEEISGRLALTENPVLDDISGLSGLRRVGGILLRNNFALDDVTPLHGVESIEGDLIIEDCTDLSTADAYALRDAIGPENIGGAVIITGNAKP